MIAAVGHADASAQSLELVEAGPAARLQECSAPPGAVVRAGTARPPAFGRAVHRAGLPLALLPAQGGVPALLGSRDRAAAGVLLLLAEQVRLMPGDRRADSRTPLLAPAVQRPVRIPGDAPAAYD